MQEDILNLEIRKFLKRVGITSQREIEQRVRELAAAGELKEGAFDANMQLRVPGLDLHVNIDGVIRTME